MPDSIQQLVAHVQAWIQADAKPYYLLVDSSLGQVLDWQGDGEPYGYGELQKNADCSGQLDFLIGTTAELNEPLELEFIQTPSGRHARIHLLGTEEGWAIAFLDASREYEMQRHRQQVANNLAMLDHERERLVRDLERVNRMKSLFIGRMSHEFRTPLSSILGHTELLLEDPGEGMELRRQLRAVQRGAKYLTNMVDNLLDQARLQQGELALYPAICDIHDIAEELEEMFRPLANQKKLSFSWWLGAEMPARIWVDGLRLRQVLINLLGNAFKFTRQGSVSVDYDWRDGRLEIAVEDTGPGISAEAAARVFQPFEQTGGNPDEARGAGLGLAISRALVERMGGLLELDTASGQGARLVFSVEASAQAGGRTADATPLRGAHILVADDDEDILALLKVYLAALDCKVSSCRTGEQVLQTAVKHSPDLVLMDMHLGSSWGHQVTQSLREQGYEKPVVIMSAADDERVRKAAQQAGCNDFLPKPFARSDLLEHLEPWLDTSVPRYP